MEVVFSLNMDVCVDVDKVKWPLDTIQAVIMDKSDFSQDDMSYLVMTISKCLGQIPHVTVDKVDISTLTNYEGILAMKRDDQAIRLLKAIFGEEEE